MTRYLTQAWYTLSGAKVYCIFKDYLKVWEITAEQIRTVSYGGASGHQIMTESQDTSYTGWQNWYV